MLAAVNLLRRGITDFRIVEKGGDFGGTWYWNRYPGCMCDVESYIYLPLLEETGYMPTERYASASEIFAHCQRIGSTSGCTTARSSRPRSTSLVWDDDACRWDLVTTRGDKLRTRFFVAAGGLMHKAKLPGHRRHRDASGARRSTRPAGTTPTPAAARPSPWTASPTRSSASSAPAPPPCRPCPSWPRRPRRSTSSSARRPRWACAASARPTRSGSPRSSPAGRRSASGTSPRSSPAASPTATWWPTAGARSCARTPSARPPTRRTPPSSRRSTSR